jgi:hypothetical protein
MTNATIIQGLKKLLILFVLLLVSLDDGLKKMIKEAAGRRKFCRGSWNITECVYG